MAQRSFARLDGDPIGVRLISTDIFDTLLLRKPVSERSRILTAETRFAGLLARDGLKVSAHALMDARLQAQKLAFRALDTAGGRGEVRTIDIVRRQLLMLGLPEALIELRLGIEIEVEKASLMANRPLGDLLRRHREAGRRIVAVSDIGLSATQLGQLIEHFHGPDLLDRIYSSADEGLTKRQGGLFCLVMTAEGVEPAEMMHVGDDETADCERPAAMGIGTVHVPRSRWRRRLSRLDGARTELRRRMRRHLRGRTAPFRHEAACFGRDVLGPIVAEFCLRIWLYADQARKGEDEAVLMFCARGGIGIREAFERVMERLNLPLPVRRENLMISRLAAARSAVVRRSPAALDELGREFAGGSFADVAQALSGGCEVPSERWRRRFIPAEFYALLESEEGREALAAIERQNDLFSRHFDAVRGGATRVLLCDTGLYGSTQRLLAAGFPDLSIETVQFARCNYKGLSEEHFPRVAGLVVEENLYNPLRIETTILRYWHLIESLFEPAVASVRDFREDETGAVISNCGDIRHGVIDPAAGNAMLGSVLAYIDDMTDGATVLTEAERAWPQLKRAIINPSSSDVFALEVGDRSVDFGRPDIVSTIQPDSGASLIGRIRLIRSHLWREGAIAREFSILRPALLAAVEAAHMLRGLSAQRYR